MNFFGHTVVALRVNDDPRFALGAMLPDLLKMGQLAYESIEDELIRAGEAFHLLTDEVFHRAPSFRALLQLHRRNLTAAGVSRGCALAVPHVGVELLLDGWLARERRWLRDYEVALDSFVPGGAAIHWTTPDGDVKWRELRGRLREGRLVEAYRDPELVARRLIAMLARRPRLTLAARDERVVETWTREAEVSVAERAQELLAEVFTALEKAEIDPGWQEGHRVKVSVPLPGGPVEVGNKEGSWV